MSNAFEPQTQHYEPQPQSSGSGKGCLWGCLILGGLLVAAVLCAGFSGYWFLSSTMNKYTSDKPVELPTVEYSEEELETLQARVDSFKEKLDAGEVPDEDLVLTADDINAMIAGNEDLKGRVFVKLENDQVQGDVSIPLDKMPFGKGRFLNASGTFEVSMDGGVLIVTAEQLTVNGEQLPDEFMQGMREQNIAKDFYDDRESAEFLRRFEDIRVQDNQFILRVKRGETEPSGLMDEATSTESGIQENPLMDSEPPAETATESADSTDSASELEAAVDSESAAE